MADYKEMKIDYGRLGCNLSKLSVMKLFEIESVGKGKKRLSRILTFL